MLLFQGKRRTPMKSTFRAVPLTLAVLAVTLVLGRPASAVAQGKKPILTKTDQLTADDPKDKVRTDSHHKVHSVKLASGKFYQIDMTSRDFDTYLRLEDPEGNEVATDDDGGEGLNARIVYGAKNAGDHKVIATSFAGGKTGNYNLTVRELKELKVGNGAVEVKSELTQGMPGDPFLYRNVKGSRPAEYFVVKFAADKNYQIDLMSPNFD